MNICEWLISLVALLPRDIHVSKELNNIRRHHITDGFQCEYFLSH
jgi:hypothetical protein